MYDSRLTVDGTGQTCRQTEKEREKKDGKAQHLRAEHTRHLHLRRLDCLYSQIAALG